MVKYASYTRNLLDMPLFLHWVMWTINKPALEKPLFTVKSSVIISAIFFGILSLFKRPELPPGGTKPKSRFLRRAADGTGLAEADGDAFGPQNALGYTE